MRVRLREDDFEGRSGTEELLVFEKNVELFDLSYLGLMVYACCIHLICNIDRES